MKKQIALFAVIAAALATSLISSRAQDDSAATNSATIHKRHGALPFHGKIVSVDADAKTIAVGKMVLNVTSETKIIKEGKSVELSDLSAGEMIGGSYKKDEAGKLTAVLIHAGQKAKKKTAGE